MKILALDSATAACSVAVWADGIVLAVERTIQERGQAEALLPMVERVRDQAGLDLVTIDRLAVTIGPGHFTGLRAGLATARGLSLALGRPLIGITTLAAVAAGVPASEWPGAVIVVALDSKRAELYVQAFDERLRPLTSPAARQAADIGAELLRLTAPRYVLAGDAADALAAVLLAAGAVVHTTAPARPDAAVVAALAAVAPLPGEPPAPLYLHAAETTSPRRAPPAV